MRHVRAPWPAQSHYNGKATAQFTSPKCLKLYFKRHPTLGKEGTRSPHLLLLGSMEHTWLPGHLSLQDMGTSSLPRPGAQARCFCFLLRACLLRLAMASPWPLSRPPRGTPRPSTSNPDPFTSDETSGKMPDSVGSKHVPLPRPSGSPPKSAQGSQASQILRYHRHMKDKELQSKGLCQERNGQPRRLTRQSPQGFRFMLHTTGCWGRGDRDGCAPPVTHQAPQRGAPLPQL